MKGRGTIHEGEGHSPLITGGVTVCTCVAFFCLQRWNQRLVTLEDGKLLIAKEALVSNVLQEWKFSMGCQAALSCDQHVTVM